MKNDVTFGALRELLLGIGFGEVMGQEQVVFHHEPSDTVFVFRPYLSSDAVTAYNLVEVQDMLDARGLMPAKTFENRFKKTPA